MSVGLLFAIVSTPMLRVTVAVLAGATGAFIGGIAQLCCGGGGGRPQLAQAGGRDGAALDGALAEAHRRLADQLGGV